LKKKQKNARERKLNEKTQWSLVHIVKKKRETSMLIKQETRGKKENAKEIR
jgi:hypothetical protein